MMYGVPLPDAHYTRRRMSADDPRLLGKLPRTRPGTRSGKRAPRQEPPAEPDAAAARARRGRPPTIRSATSCAVAAKAAETGLRVANELTREVLRRLPRP